MKKIFRLIPAMKKIAPVLLVSAFLSPMAARAEIKAGSVEFSPFAGYNFFQNRLNLENRPIFGGRLGYDFTEHFGVEATGEFARTRVDDKSKSFTQEGEFTSPINGVNVTMYHLDLLYHLSPEGKFNPFLAAGYGAVNYSPRINNKNMSDVDFGAGAKYWVADNVALRVDVRDNLLYDEQIHNIETTLGLVFRFGGKEKAVQFAAVQPVEPAALPASQVVGAPAVANACNECPVAPASAAAIEESRVIILASEPKVEQRVIVAALQPDVVVLAFEDVHFDFDRSTLTPEAQRILKRDLKVLQENPKARVRIAGYTSAAGSAEYNQKLSERRADAVRAFLIEEGVVKADRLSMIGYGERHPAAYEAAPSDLHSDAAMANIRVLFEIVVQ